MGCSWLYRGRWSPEGWIYAVFACGMPSAKQHKSIMWVTIFLIIYMPWWMLCLLWHQTIAYTTNKLICTHASYARSKRGSHTSILSANTHSRISVMPTLTPEYLWCQHPLQNICDATVATSNCNVICMSQTIKVMPNLWHSQNLTHGGNFCQSMLSTSLLSVIGAINSVFSA